MGIIGITALLLPLALLLDLLRLGRGAAGAQSPQGAAAAKEQDAGDRRGLRADWRALSSRRTAFRWIGWQVRAGNERNSRAAVRNRGADCRCGRRAQAPFDTSRKFSGGWKAISKAAHADTRPAGDRAARAETLQSS
jgi:hypothetical protein